DVAVVVDLVPGSALEKLRAVEHVEVARTLDDVNHVALEAGAGAQLDAVVGRDLRLGADPDARARLRRGRWGVVLGAAAHVAARHALARARHAEVGAEHPASVAIVLDLVPVAEVSRLRTLDDEDEVTGVGDRNQPRGGVGLGAQIGPVVRTYLGLGADTYAVGPGRCHCDDRQRRSNNPAR